MFNKICKVVLGIVIAAVVLFGVYKILPGQFSGVIHQFFQELTDKNAKKIIEVYSEANVPDHKGVTFKAMLVENGSNPSWYVEEVSESAGTYKVHANAYKVTLEMEKSDGGDSNKVYTRAHVEIVMDVTYSSEKATIDSISVYINDELQDDYYEKAAFDVMCQNVQ